MPKACPYAMMHPHLLWLTKIIASGMKKALAGGGCEGWGKGYSNLLVQDEVDEGGYVAHINFSVAVDVGFSGHWLGAENHVD